MDGEITFFRESENRFAAPIDELLKRQKDALKARLGENAARKLRQRFEIEST